ncbi:MAG: glutamate-5-semialdehyde dehydrogenase [Candidatus Sumerlaeia bacterium]
MEMSTKNIAQNAKKASQELAKSPTEAKNAALTRLAELLDERKSDILEANDADMKEAREKGLETAMVNRLKFGESKIESRIRCLGKIAALADPVGQVIEADRRPIGLDVKRVRTPLGVILMIYEARPHVTVNAGAFCLKSGNAAILRGGSEAKRCNAIMGELWARAVRDAGLPENSVQVISGSHEDVAELLEMDDLIDLVIPRGGKRLIQTVSEKSRIPVIKHFEGICHVYIDETADLDQAIAICIDSKTLMPEVCNAMETVLVAEPMLAHINKIVDAFRKKGVEVRACENIQALIPDVKPATEEDWKTEYLDMIVSIRAVKSTGEAIAHINQYGSHHTDSIVTNDLRSMRQFQRDVDSGVVLVNASTMYCDGESLGMGAEIGISTDKIHARGPMGLNDLTSYKFLIEGNGNVMGPV